jgi:hypothetical protein
MEFEEIDGTKIFHMIREARQSLESQPFDRAKFFRLLKHSYRCNSSLESTRSPLRKVLAILAKNDSIKFSHDPLLDHRWTPAVFGNEGTEGLSMIG